MDGIRVHHVKWNKQDSPPPPITFSLICWMYINTYMCAYMCKRKTMMRRKLNGKGRNQEKVRKSIDKILHIFSHRLRAPNQCTGASASATLWKCRQLGKRCAMGGWDSSLQEQSLLFWASAHHSSLSNLPAPHIPSCLLWQSPSGSDHRDHFRWDTDSPALLFFFIN